MKLPPWLRIQWGGDMPCPYCWVGPVLVTWSWSWRINRKGRGYKWPVEIGFAWNPD